MASDPKNGDLKIWWIPQVPSKAMEYSVTGLVEAKRMLDLLAKYDIFQYEQDIKPDYANAGGLMVYDSRYLDPDLEGDGWVDFYTVDGEELDDLSMARCEDLDKLRAKGVGVHS